MENPSYDVALEDLNFLLSDLGLDVGGGGPDDRDSARPGLQSGSFHDEAFDKSCRVVIDQVRTLKKALSPELEEKGKMVGETGGAKVILEIAVARGMPRPTGSSDSGGCGGTGESNDDPSARAARVQALSFMCSELQVLSLESHQIVVQRQQRRDVDEQDLEAARRVLKSDSEEQCVSDERLRALAVLFTLRRVLQVPDQNPASFHQIERTMAAIAAKAEAFTPNVVDDGDLPLLAGLELTPAQREMSNRVQAAIGADFELRRLMLLRRCDVTVRSFLRRKQGEDGKAEEIPLEIREKIDALKDEPIRITVDDALAAPTKVAWQHARKIMEASSAAKTSTKMAEIAEVPNRGGRVDAARARLAMPAWTARQEFDGRGRGGGRGGGRGRGGGGGRGRGGGGGRGGGRGGGWRGGGGGSGGWRGGRGRRGGGGARGGGGQKRKWDGHGDMPQGC